MKTVSRILTFAAGVLFCGASAYAEGLPQGLSFVGLKSGEWRLYVVPKGAKQPQHVPTVSEPRTPAFHRESGKVAYIAADGTLREHHIDDESNKTILTPGAEHAYTQPAYDPSGNRLYVVELKESASVDTDILVLDKTRNKPRPLVTQRSAQFEPVVPTAHDLYYANVLCTVGCGKIIQEIWHMNTVSGEARQLTLVNAIARQPALSNDGEWLYFSSNIKGNYHIWRMSLAAKNYEQLTQGVVSDVSPAVDEAGNVYFIRRSPQGVQLMRLSANGDLTVMNVPEEINDLRDLEIGR